MFRSCGFGHTWPVFAPALALFATVVVAADGVTPRRYQVHDTVEMSYFGTLVSSMPFDMDYDAVVSPDGRYFLKVTHRGVLPEGVTEGTIWRFETGSTQHSVNRQKVPVARPLALARMSTAANGTYGFDLLDAGNAITELRWADDSRSATFLGRDGRNNRQIFSLDMDSLKLEALTPPTQDVISYSRSGSSFAYLVGPDADLQAAQAWVSAGSGIPDITIGTGTSLMPLLYPHFKGNSYGEPVELELWQVRGQRVSPVIDARTKTAIKLVADYGTLALSLSPDATRVVTIAQEKQPEKPDKMAPSLRYRLIDIDTGSVSTLVGSPIVDAQWGKTGRYRAAWSADSSEIVLTEVMLTKSGTSTELERCTVALVRIAAGNANCIAQPESPPSEVIHSVNWSPSGEAIRLTYQSPRNQAYTDVLLRRRGPKWIVERTAADSSGTALRFSIHESLNEPPTLVATDTRSGKSRSIFDPNPQLANVALGSVTLYEWKDSHGRTNHGGLVKPPDYSSSKRYALVLQTHGFDRDRFFTAGYALTSNAGRAFAGRDMVVLQVDEPVSDKLPTWSHGTEVGTDVYLAAIDQLAADGVIDPKKVGITGYSYSGWLVATSITRAPDRFAAAELANTDPVTLTGYYEYVDTPLAQVVADAFVGAKPYGDGLKSWIEHVPSFATDKITAPVLFQAADPWHLIGFWDMYAAMRDQGKPVELQYMRSGQHNIRKPLQILAHEELLVDWFDFWLNGHEDSDKTKIAQYQRWRALREARGVKQAKDSSIATDSGP